MYTKKSLEKIFENVEMISECGCWIWMGSIGRKGYGRVEIYGIELRAHRLSWEFHHGPIPEGLCVLHRCDVRSCVNPQHLFLGTNDDNIRDMVAKKRQSAPRGEHNGSAKLSESDVKNIRADNRFQRIIASDYGISQTSVCNIKNHRRWKTVNG